MSSPFYYRVFTSIERNIWADEVERFIEESGLGLSVIGIVDEDDAEKLDAVPVELLLCDEDESEVATLVYDRLDASDVLAEEISEFQEVIQEMFPECNRSWVADKLAHSIGCYCFTVFDAGLLNENWDRLATLAEWLRDETNGIEQSDGGQITNEQGAVVLVTPFEDEVEEDDSDDEESDEEFDDDDDEFEEGDDEETAESDDWGADSVDDGSDDFDDEEEDCFSDEFDLESDSSEEYDEDDSSFEDESGDDDDSEEEEIDDSELEDEEESEDFVAAVRIGDRWVEKQVDSDESLEEFMRGEV